MTHLLAHQGGWDELLLVAIPLMVLAGLLVLASVRAKRIAAARDSPTTPTDDD